jgi:hypothetical protein
MFFRQFGWRLEEIHEWSMRAQLTTTQIYEKAELALRPCRFIQRGTDTLEEPDLTLGAAFIHTPT